MYSTKILSRRGKFKYTEKVIRCHPFGIGIGTTGSTEVPKYRISFGVPSSAFQQSLLIPYVPICVHFRLHLVTAFSSRDMKQEASGRHETREVSVRWRIDGRQGYTVLGPLSR